MGVRTEGAAAVGTAPDRRRSRKTMVYAALLTLAAAAAIGGKLYMESVRAELSNEVDTSGLPAMPTDGRGPSAGGAASN